MRISARSTTLGLAFCAMLAAGGHAHAGSCASASPNGPTAFTFSGRIVVCTIPATGVYSLSAWGANGGPSIGGSKGGVGTFVSANMNLTAGQELQILVGGAGGLGPTYNQNFHSSGGGGGTYIFVQSQTPLIIAGGGGGAGAYGSAGSAGVPLQGTQPSGGSNGANGGAGAGGTNGSGGGGGTGGPGGGGGAGFNTNGGNSPNVGGGQGITSGGAGGVCFLKPTSKPRTGGYGGFGGGGCGGVNTNYGGGGGGGGGWGGGGGGGDNTIPPDGGGGGGGGSYVNANVAVAGTIVSCSGCSTLGAAAMGNGQVWITNVGTGNNLASGH